MPAWLSSPLVPGLAAAAAGGVVAFLVTRRLGRLAGIAVFVAVLVAAFVVVRPMYASATHCDGAFVPGWMAFSVASGTWPGIYCGGEPAGTYGPVRVALLGAVHALVPGAALLLMMWPCR